MDKYHILTPPLLPTQPPIQTIQIPLSPTPASIHHPTTLPPYPAWCWTGCCSCQTLCPGVQALCPGAGGLEPEQEGEEGISVGWPHLPPVTDKLGLGEYCPIGAEEGLLWGSPVPGRGQAYMEHLGGGHDEA